MAWSDYFSFRTTVSADDPPGKIVAAYAEYEGRTGRIVKSNDSMAWNPDGTIDKTPLL